MLTYTSHKTFDDVVKHYENIRPLVSQYHKLEDDVRPIGDRARKWETITKISRNCYAISAGYERGNKNFPYWGYRTYVNGQMLMIPTAAKLERYAPIVWRKAKNGEVTVTVNNVCGSYGISSHFDMIRRHIPKGLSFITNPDGKQFIRMRNCDTRPPYTVRGGIEYYLAKTKTIPRGEYARIMSNQYMNRIGFTPYDDNAALVFKWVSEGVWEHVAGTGKPLPVAPRVNKELKAKYKADIQSFFEWGMTMTPMLLDKLDYTSRHLASQELSEHIRAMSSSNHNLHWDSHITREQASAMRKILRNDAHDMRVNVWIHFMGAHTYEYRNQDMKAIRSAYNRYINRYANFMV